MNTSGPLNYVIDSSSGSDVFDPINILVDSPDNLQSRFTAGKTSSNDHAWIMLRLDLPTVLGASKQFR